MFAFRGFDFFSRPDSLHNHLTAAGSRAVVHSNPGEGGGGRAREQGARGTSHAGGASGFFATISHCSAEASIGTRWLEGRCHQGVHNLLNKQAALEKIEQEECAWLR